LLPLLLVIALWSVVYVPTLFYPALLDDADSVHAEAAREMVLRGDWVTMYANGIRYLAKAPLMYWGVAASYRLGGVSEWTTRLPVTAGFLVLLCVVYFLGSRAYGRPGGFYAALVLATSVGPYLFTRFLIPDIIVGLWLAIGLALFLGTLGRASPSRLACWGFAATVALGVLTKGYIGLVFPCGIVFLYLLLTRNLRHLLRLRIPEMAAVFLLIAAPWHILAVIRTPLMGQAEGVPLSFAWCYLWNEQVLRFVGKCVPHDYDKVPLLAFWGLALLWLFPWVVFLFSALRRVRLRLDFRNSGEGQRLDLLCLIWALVILGFFSFSTRQEYYTLPAAPALALLIGGWLAREAAGRDSENARRSGRIASVVLLLIALPAGAVALFLGITAPAVGGSVDLAELLNPDPSRYALSMGHFFDLTPRALGAFRSPLLLTGAALVIGALSNWWARRRNRPAHGNIALAIMMSVLLVCAQQGFARFNPVLGSKELADAIQREYHPGELIEINGEYEEGSTINFYTGVQVRILNGRSSNLWYGSLFPDAPAIFDDTASFQRLWQGSTRVYLVTAEKKRPKLAENGYVLARSGGKLVVSNRPGAAR